MELRVFTDTEFIDLDRVLANLTGKIPIILEGIGVYMVASVIQNFEAGGRPEKWQKLAPSTLAQKQKSGKTLTLIESGLLKAGIMSWVEGDSVLIGPTGPAKPYARIQAKGGETGRDHQTIIPSRDYLLLQQEDEEYIRNFIRGEILEK